jgi:predicted nuclease of predicted toxin-antitoxin system
MRLLLDNNLSPRLLPLLARAGHDVEHVRDHSLASARDAEVLHHARAEGRILISADTDFGTLLARTGAVDPSVVLLRRSQGRRVEQVAGLLMANLPDLRIDLEAGAVAVIRDDTIRVRRLPLPPGH